MPKTVTDTNIEYALTKSKKNQTSFKTLKTKRIFSLYWNRKPVIIDLYFHITLLQNI